MSLAELDGAVLLFRGAIPSSSLADSRAVNGDLLLVITEVSLLSTRLLKLPLLLAGVIGAIDSAVAVSNDCFCCFISNN